MTSAASGPVTAVKIDGEWTTAVDKSIALEPLGRRLRAVLGGHTVLDTLDACVLLESGHLPVYYIPRGDIDAGCLTATDHSSHCPHKGDASYWTVSATGKTVTNGAWAYPRPTLPLPALAELMAFDWHCMDAWFEEDEQVFRHARDPRKAIYVVDTFRPVEVVIDGVTVASSRHARMLHETDLPARFYLPAEDVRTELLTPTATRTRCPYKGEAVYWSARVGERVIDDVVWSYPRPIAECPRIAGLLCFFNEVVDATVVDGVEVPKQRTKWSRD